ncbi:RNA polymerase sigma factor [Micromonospora chersina]|uniref:RNA polymerase sigma factor n=1 Tax=Micromonospora chersina TaxID=47854 RepID=UPI0037201B3A
MGHTRLIGSDPEALETFYAAYYRHVVRYFARRCADPHDVADLVADTFLTAVESAGGFDSRRGKPIAWLLGIAHNTLRRYYRKAQADRHLENRISGRRLLDVEDIDLIEEQIDAARKAAEVRHALAALSATDRELLELIEVDGLTTAEAARALGSTPAAARVRLFRIRIKLRSALVAKEEAR